MTSKYTKESLRSIFQSAFDFEQWYSILQNVFHASELKSHPEKIQENSDIESFYLGNIDSSDSYRIGLFYYNIEQGSVLKKRVGLRSLVKSFVNPKWGEFDAAIAVFDSHDHWRLSFICDIKGENIEAKRYTYVFGCKALLYRTPIERFTLLQKTGISFNHLKTAFSVEALSKEFFDKYREQYADFIQYVTGKRFVKVGGKWKEKTLSEPDNDFMQAFNYDDKKIRDYIKKMMGRITFLHFLQRKGWMNGDLNYMQNLFERSPYKNDYLDSVLEPLFFGILNTQPSERKDLFSYFDWDNTLLNEWKDIPYLNGGLFERDADDEPQSRFPAEYFQRLFKFFSEYNFTIDENDPNDAEIGVDPEMLGKIFENLLEDNKDKGAFYTPKEIVRYMCQESLIAYLEKHTSLAKEKVRKFVLFPEEGIIDVPENKKNKLRIALENVKICDPAIGSGAFPMGLLNELLHCREVLSRAECNRAEIKKSIIQNNIYGVDIEKGAVDIARLRFWLAIVVDDDTPSPLPNLDYKIMQGNSLLESYMGVDLSRLTYEKKREKDSSQVSLFDDDKDRQQKIIYQLLTVYYSCSNHNRKIELQQEISENIKLQLESQGYDATLLAELEQLNLAENNKFFLWHTWFSDVFNRQDSRKGFDIIIGNPPYLKEGRANKSIFNKIRNSVYYQGKMDYWYLFACNGLDLITNNGILCFIATNNWITSYGASKLRNKVIKETRLLNFIDFGSSMVFDNASIQTMIMCFRKDSITDNYVFDYRKINSSNTSKHETLKILSKKTSYAEYFDARVVRDDFYNKNLTFTKDSSLVNKLSSKDTFFLSKDEIAQGIVTPQDFLNKKNKEILGNDYKIGEGIFVLTTKEREYLSLNPCELSLIKPLYTSKQIHKYYTNPQNTLWIIYTDSKFKKPDIMYSFPNIKSHLDRFLDIITSANKPYGLHRSRKKEIFSGEKIVALRKSVGAPIFSYIDFDAYMLQSFNIIKTEKVCMKYLTGVLNSTLLKFWLKNKGKMQGDNFQLDTQPLMEIPIINATKEQQNEIGNLVMCIISLKKENITNKTTDLEREIDTLVYKLYNLSEDDIKFIETSMST